MEFRSYADLARTLTKNRLRVPPDVDVVVSIPRSGIIPATMLALALNRPMTDVEGLLAGRLISAGDTRRFRPLPQTLRDCRHALVVDDSILSGNTLSKVRQRIADARLPLKITYAAVYATQESARLVDIYFEICPNPRLFEWNYLHHKFLGTAIVELDGVICPRPGETARNDANTPAFLRDALPHIHPSHRIHHLVTRQPARLRAETEDWLQRHRIAYDRLSLFDPPAGSQDWQSAYAAWKADLLKADDEATLFIQAEPDGASEIARRSGKPVICFETHRMYPPRELSLPAVQLRARRFRHRAARLMHEPFRYVLLTRAWIAKRGASLP